MRHRHLFDGAGYSPVAIEDSLLGTEPLQTEVVQSKRGPIVLPTDG